MNAELALVPAPSDLAELPREERGLMITQALESSKQWLTVATKGTDPTAIVHFRAWACTVAEMTKQKGLAEEIQLDALEMVRRAERGIGLAIRNGQEAGEIRKVYETGGPKGDYERNGRPVRIPQRDQAADGSPISPSGFGLRRDALARGVYPVTDDVTDTEFEQALGEAREEGNLTRTNVIRKTRLLRPERRPRFERSEQIARLAAKNLSARQIAPELGISEERVREIARKEGIDIPGDRFVARTRRIDPTRVITSAIESLGAAQVALSVLAPEDFGRLDPADCTNWITSIDQYLRDIRALRKELSRAHEAYPRSG